MRPDVYASVSWPLSRTTRYWPALNDSRTSPSNSIFSSFSAKSRLLEKLVGRGPRSLPHRSSRRLRDELDVLRLGALRALSALELDLRALGEGLEALAD